MYSFWYLRTNPRSTDSAVRLETKTAEQSVLALHAEPTSAKNLTVGHIVVTNTANPTRSRARNPSKKHTQTAKQKKKKRIVNQWKIEKNWKKIHPSSHHNSAVHPVFTFQMEKHEHRGQRVE
jgi:hypothetical protein